MKKRLISGILAMMLCLALLPHSVFADQLELDYSTPPEISQLEICQEGSDAWIQLTEITPPSVRSVIDLLEFFGKSDYISGIQLSLSLEGGNWRELDLRGVNTSSTLSGTWRTETIQGLKSDSWVQVRARFTGVTDSGEPVLSDWSDTLVINAPAEKETFEFRAHDWAKAELAEADELGLIPADLRAEDLTRPITRAEFAAVSVRVYEALSGTAAEAAPVNPFTDTDDPEVLKALGVGITNGLSDTVFAPDRRLNREQAATMLTRVYKKIAFPGWSLETDKDYDEAFRALYTMPEPFADDGDISAWARDSVYFMASKGVLKGMEGNTFQPRAVTEEQQAGGYAQATREQALLIAVRLVKNLKG